MLSAFAGGRLFGERTGGSPAHVLALHGWRGSHVQMAGVVEDMPAISLDLPGFGASPTPDAVWGAGDYAGAVLPVLDELAAPVVIVGYSFGGRVAVHLAVLAPMRVNALVLTGVPLLRRASAHKTSWTFRAARFAHRHALLSDKQMESQRRKRGSSDYRAAQGIMRDVFVRLVNESYEEQLDAITCPVHLVWGQHDTEVPLELAKMAQRRLSNAELVVVPGGSHWLPTENPQPIREAIAKCLA